ncbi:multiheme c-type cytochrome [Ruegeria hyattellae]|uniref:multiheme c-type cytochrome n=1 Tax=Ruegeria hyattellae TaxID=3233337 RepID=UPI00355B76BF
MHRLFALFCLLWAMPASAQVPDYVGSERCISCHEEAGALWSGSHHAKAWTRSGPDTVLADFDGTSFAHDGMEVTFRIEGSDYLARVVEKDGSTTEYKLHSVVGVAPLQQYLFETGRGHLQSFDVVWDVEQGEWLHLYPDQDLPPDDGLHWTGPYKNWNARCAECHATGYRRNYGQRTRSYAADQAEIGVGCEACHGPGSAHLDWTTGKAPADGLSDYGFTMDFASGSEALIGQCAGCHSRREALADGNPLPGTPYHDAYTLALLRPGQYHADGQILDEVYVYGSFLQSKMYANGVTCLNCHNAHSGDLLAEGNAVCTQCHSPAGNPEFPSLSLGDYDSAAHHHHSEGAGTQCVSCHMPEQVYMQVDPRRDHSFRIPRPDLAAETGAPDTCTSCHSDRDPNWAAERIAIWFPDDRNRQPHFGQVFARARSGPESTTSDLRSLAQDEAQPGIIRATALFLLEPAATPNLATEIAGLLNHDDALIRSAAASLQRAAPPADRLQRLLPILQDPRRSVRIAAAKQMINVPPEIMSNSQRAIVQQAMADWQRSIRARLDFPETHLVLGGIALVGRNPEAAERAFREVVTLDPQHPDAWPMLVRLVHANKGPEAARQTLREGLTQVPDHPGLLGLQSQMNP